MTQTGTLEELDVKPGDVVKVVETWNGEKVTSGGEWIICEDSERGLKPEYYPGHRGTLLSKQCKFTIVSRASDTPKTWGEMTDEEAQDIAHEIRKHMDLNQNRRAGLIPISTRMLLTQIADAIKPEPVVEEVVAYAQPDLGGGYEVNSYCDHWAYRITFTTKDGEIATGTFRNEAGDVVEVERINDQS